MNSNFKRHEEVWQDISDALIKEGYNFSHLQCEDKWKYLKKLYVNTVDKNKQSGTSENTCPYFKEFDEIYGRPLYYNTCRTEEIILNQRYFVVSFFIANLVA